MRSVKQPTNLKKLKIFHYDGNAVKKMELIVDDNGGGSVNFVVGHKRSKSCVNTSLSLAFDSHFKAKTSLTNESIYEVSTESVNGDSDNKVYNYDCDADSLRNMIGKLNVLETSENPDQNNSQNPSDSAEMDEMFVVVDDSNETDEKNDCTEEISDANEMLSDCNNIDEVLKKGVLKEEKSAPRFSDNDEDIESATDEFNVIDTKEEKNSDTRVILSSSDDEIDTLLEDFKEENTSSESSIPASVNTDAASPIVNQNLELSTNNINVLKDLSNNVENKETYEESNSAENSVKTIKIDSLIKNKSVCEIASDEKSNDSNISITQTIQEDDDAVKKSQNKSSVEILQEKLSNHDSPLNSPAFSSSSEDKFELESVILDIVDKTEEANENSNLDSNSKLKDSFESSSHVVSVHKNKSKDEEKSESNTPSTSTLNENTQSNLNKDISEPSISILEKNTQSLNIDISESSTSTLKQNTQSNLNKDISDNGKLDSFLICNGNVSPSSDSSSSSTKKHKSCDTKAQDSTNCSTTNTATTVNNHDNNELITNNNLDCEETEEPQVVITFVSGSKSQKDESQTENADQSCDVATSEESEKKLDIEVDDKTKLEVKTDIDNVKTEDDVREEEKTNGKCTSDVEMEEVNDDNEKNSATRINEEEEKKLAGDERTADSQIKLNSCQQSETIAENKVTNSVEHENIKNECQQNEDDVNKRKLEDCDDEVKVKKLKLDNENKEDTQLLNGDIISNEPSDLKEIKVKEEIVEVKTAILDTAHSLFNTASSSMKCNITKCKLDKKKLVQLALNFSVRPWGETIRQAMETSQLLKNAISDFSIVKEKYEREIPINNGIIEKRELQRREFAKLDFRPKVPTRTVGVNVKIYRESEVQNANQNAAKTKVFGENSVSSNPALLVDNKPLIPKDTVISPSVANQQVVRKPLLPRIITQTTKSGPTQVVTLSSRLPPPNVTVSGTKLIPVGKPPNSLKFLVPSGTITSSSTNRIVTEDQKMQKVASPGAASITPTSTISKVNVPNMPGNSNVLLPLKDYLQMLPAGSKGTAILQQPGSGPTLIPPLPSSLVGRTVTYIVPQNSTLGGQRIQSFIPTQNQQVQYVLRVTNPGSVPGLTTVVNSVPRTSVMQPPLATAPRLQTPVPPVTQAGGQRNSGLILISHTTKHPAPFPKSPQYPDNKQKAIPPKPSLKGSKNSSGIVLSWNMNLTNKNAGIASYQLFAYQESDGPVDASLWKKVGDVNALPLPMACTLTQFVDKNKYYFTVRAVDVFQRFGPFSDPVSILFEKDGDVKKEK